jgi:hypothetical protein
VNGAPERPSRFESPNRAQRGVHRNAVFGVPVSVAAPGSDAPISIESRRFEPFFGVQP